MGLFGGVKDAKFSEGGVYLGEGVFRLQINACKQIRTRTGKDAFLAEFTVAESTNVKHLPGSQVTWMVTFDKEPALGNVKQFIATAITDELTARGMSGDPMGHVDEPLCELVVGPSQPLKGKFIRASGNNIKTKAGRDFTKVKFLPDSAGHAAMVAAQAA